MIVQIGISFGVANYIQYATFMSSRAYLSGWKNAAQQRRAAETVIDRMMTLGGRPRFKAFAKPTEDAVFIGGLRVAAAGSSEARTRNWEQGMTYKFDARMHMIPLIRSSSFSARRIHSPAKPELAGSRAIQRRVRCIHEPDQRARRLFTKADRRSIHL